VKDELSFSACTMDGMGENISEQETKASFWKKNTKAVPGRWGYVKFFVLDS